MAASRFVDAIHIGLVSVTLVIDLVALSAILFRLRSHGFTPNRLAVPGANLLVFGDLAGILCHYPGLFEGNPRSPFFPDGLSGSLLR